MNKIYENANDQHIRSFVVFGKTADKKLYVDSAKTVKATKAEVVEAFEKGMLIIDDGTSKLIPVAMTSTKIVTIDASTAASPTAVEWNIPTA